MALLCCAAPLSVAGDEPAAPLQKQNVPCFPNTIPRGRTKDSQPLGLRETQGWAASSEPGFQEPTAAIIIGGNVRNGNSNRY
jgi:hypothetical protein